jgi:hypothetical protein
MRNIRRRWVGSAYDLRNHKETTTWREGHRLRARALFQQGWRVGLVAAALGVTHSAVSQWLARDHLAAKSAVTPEGLLRMRGVRM